MDWIKRYEAGQGTDAQMSELLNQIETVDGWNLTARINAGFVAQYKRW